MSELLRFDMGAVIALMGEPPPRLKSEQDAYWNFFCDLVLNRYGMRQHNALFLVSGCGPDEFHKWANDYAKRFPRNVKHKKSGSKKPCAADRARANAT
jgi:hypothetical protein